jgi:uroporphyrinogen decarboxylase
MIDLKRGGGFVFAAVHNIQANVSPENVFAMWAAFREHASYGGELELSEMPRR